MGSLAQGFGDGSGHIGVRGQTEQIEVVPSGLLRSRGPALRSGLELHGHQACRGSDSAPSLGHHLSALFGDEREVLSSVEGPTMSQNKDAVCLPLWQEVRCDVARRHVSNGDAVDLRTEEEPVDTFTLMTVSTAVSSSPCCVATVSRS